MFRAAWPSFFTFLSSKIYHSIILACNGVVNHSLLLKWYNFPLDHMHVWLSGKLYHLTPLVTSSLTRQNKKKTFIKFGSKILSVFLFPFHLILPLFIPGLKWNCNCLVHTPPHLFSSNASRIFSSWWFNSDTGFYVILMIVLIYPVFINVSKVHQLVWCTIFCCFNSKWIIVKSRNLLCKLMGPLLC